MITHILVAIGGVGLFLFGMMTLTDGLRRLAGNSMRRALAAYTRTPTSGAVTGAITTALIQSSSATTVTAIGFVGAGVISFSQALGVIFGANIGTTITGWLVALIGFKLNVGFIALPLMLVGALMRMFGGQRTSHIGGAIAGFSLLFIGIETMQEGLAHFEGVVTPASFPDDTWGGRFLLLLIGVVITLVTQSSSAGVATAMAALAAGTISFPQAAAMVIGMDVGTTFTAALATLGGSSAMRQTGYAHVIYNMMTGIMAFLMLGPYTAVVGDWAMAGASGNAQVAVVGFHTFFNTIGVILVLPFTRRFAEFIERLVPGGGPPLERGLDAGLLRDAAVATEAAAQTVRRVAREVFTITEALLDPDASRRIDQVKVQEIERGIGAALDFLENIKPLPGQEQTASRHAAALHALDHLSRLHHRCAQTERIDALFADRRLRRLAGLLRKALKTHLDRPDGERALKVDFDRLRQVFRRQRAFIRDRMIRHAAHDGIDWPEMMLRLDGARWLHRVSYHVWRIEHHMERFEIEDVR